MEEEREREEKARREEGRGKRRNGKQNEEETLRGGVKSRGMEGGGSKEALK